MREEVIEGVMRSTRRMFHLMRAVGDGLHADLGVSTAMRGVMESLAQSGPQTVPRMARQRPVSRQHIQILVNQLIEAGLCQTRANPDHKRSALVDLTVRGRAVFAVMRKRERGVIAELADDMDPADLAACERVHQHIIKALEPRLHRTSKETIHDDEP